jgi:hypothetical protein
MGGLAQRDPNEEGADEIGPVQTEPARSLGQDTLQRCRQVLGPDHPITQYLTHAASNGHLLLGEAPPDFR